MKEQQKPRSALKIFYAYARKDEVLRETLEDHLSQLRHEGAIIEWHDRQIPPGADWSQAIDQAINTAHIILLLISSDFLASRYCYGVEMQTALDRHRSNEAYVIPIILRPCDWHTAPFGRLQCLPRDGKAVTTWDNQDEAFVDIVGGIRKTIGMSQSWMPDPSAVLLLRSFIRSLVIIPDNIWTKVEVAERAHSPRESLASPEVIEKILDEIDLLCSDDEITLSPNWRQEYWTGGFIKAITQRERKTVLNFLERADDDLLSIVIELRPFKYITRIRICRMKLYTQEEVEEYFRRCLNTGLLYEGMPQGKPGSYSYIGQMSHQVTPLVSRVGRLLDMSGVQPQIPAGKMS